MANDFKFKLKWIRPIAFIMLLILLGAGFQNCSNKPFEMNNRVLLLGEKNEIVYADQSTRDEESRVVLEGRGINSNSETLTEVYCQANGYQKCYNKYQEILRITLASGPNINWYQLDAVKTSAAVFQNYAYSRLQEIHKIDSARTTRLFSPSLENNKIKVRGFSEFRPPPKKKIEQFQDGTYLVFFRPDFSQSGDSLISLMGHFQMDGKYRPEDLPNAQLGFPSGLHWHVGVLVVKTAVIQFYDCTSHMYPTNTNTFYLRDNCSLVSLNKLDLTAKPTSRTTIGGEKFEVSLLDELRFGYPNEVMDFIKLIPSNEKQAQSRMVNYFNQNMNGKPYSFWNYNFNSNTPFSFNFSDGFNCSVSAYKMYLQYFNFCPSVSFDTECRHRMETMSDKIHDYMPILTSSPLSKVQFSPILVGRGIWNIHPSSLFWSFITDPEAKKVGYYYGSILAPK